MRLRAIGFVLFFTTAASAGPTAPAATMTSTAQPVALAHPSLLVRPQLRTGMTLKDVFAASNAMPSVPPPPSSNATVGTTTTVRCVGGGTAKVTWQAAGHVDPSTGTGSYGIAMTLDGCVSAQNGGTKADGTITILYKGSSTSTQTASTTNMTGNWKWSYDGALTVTNTTSNSSLQTSFVGFSVAFSAKVSVTSAGTGTVGAASVSETETLDGKTIVNGQATTYSNQSFPVAVSTS